MRDDSDKAQISCINFRVHGDPDQVTDGEEQNKRSLVQFLLMDVLQFSNKDK